MNYKYAAVILTNEMILTNCGGWRENKDMKKLNAK